jgi:hypothetical protein
MLVAKLHLFLDTNTPCVCHFRLGESIENFANIISYYTQPRHTENHATHNKEHYTQQQTKINSWKTLKLKTN